MSVALSIDFDSIRARHPLPEYCQKRGIELRKNGASDQWVGLCPLHKEKSPSFYVFPDARYHCFGCGAHGDVTDLEQALLGGTRAEAAARLGAESKPTPAIALVEGAADFLSVFDHASIAGVQHLVAPICLRWRRSAHPRLCATLYGRQARPHLRAR